MATSILENVDDMLVARLSALAARAGRTVEQQAVAMLDEALSVRRSFDRAVIAASIAAMTPAGASQTDSIVLLREDRACDDKK